jgi:hypothetical protein
VPCDDTRGGCAYSNHSCGPQCALEVAEATWPTGRHKSGLCCPSITLGRKSEVSLHRSSSFERSMVGLWLMVTVVAPIFPGVCRDLRHSGADTLQTRILRWIRGSRWLRQSNAGNHGERSDLPGPGNLAGADQRISWRRLTCSRCASSRKYPGARKVDQTDLARPRSNSERWRCICICQRY